MISTALEKFLSVARNEPEKVAIYYKDNKTTYGQLLALVKYYAAYFDTFKEAGPIAIHLDRSPKMVAALLSCWYANRAFVALDPKHPIMRKKYILGQDNASENNKIEDFQLIKSNIDKNTAYILYTSGSTGKPKGVEITHSNVAGLINWANSYYTKNQLSCILASTTITFDLSVFEIFVPLSLGFSIYLVDNILDLLDTTYDYSKITLINTVPTVIREILRANVIPKNVNTVNLAGEVLIWNLVESLYKIPNIKRVYNLWGPSEDTTYSTSYECPQNQRGQSRALQNTPKVPIGKAIKGTKVHIINKEICLSGIGLAKGYFNNKELTAQKFITIDDIRLYRTGDIGFEDQDGNIHFKGRLDFQVKVKGFRIELEEIECHLLNIKDIVTAAATTIEDNNQTKLVIGVQLENLISNKNHIEYFKKKLTEFVPSYMIPSYWWLTDKALPKTPNGKLCRKAINKIILSKYLAEKNINKNNINISRTDEISFYDLVSNILGTKTLNNLNFTAQGGDSLAAVRLLIETNNLWQNNLTLKNILDNDKTLFDLNNLIVKGKNKNASKNKDVIESNCQNLANVISAPEARMWKVYTNAKYAQSYNISVTYNLEGDLNVEKLIKSCKDIILNNNSFKYNYIITDGHLKKQLIQNKKARGLFKVISTTPSDFFDKRFCLEKDFLARAVITKKTDSKYILSFCFPHIVIDGFGIKALTSQISHAYNADIINIKQPSVLQEGNLTKACNFWLNEFKNCNTEIKWPENNIASKANYTKLLYLKNDKVKHLEEVAQKTNSSLPVLLLTAFEITLYLLGFGKDFNIGCPVANRAHKEQQNVVSNLVNTLPFRCVLKDNITVEELLKANHNKLLDMLAYQDVSIDKIILGISDKIDLPDSLFDILFSYMDFEDNLKLGNVSSKRIFVTQKHSKASLVISAIVNKDKSIDFVFECLGEKLKEDFLEAISDVFNQILSNINKYIKSDIKKINRCPTEHQAIIESNIKNIKNNIADNTMHLVDWFINTVNVNNSKIAIVDGENKITYKQLFLEAQKIALGILEKGAVHGQAIGLSMPRSWKIVSSILGILLSGCHYVPLDPRNPVKRNQYIIENSNIRITIDDDNYDNFVKSGETCNCSNKKNHLKKRSYDSNDLAYVIYTSGTTGVPKGVAVTHKNISRLFSSCQKWGCFSNVDIWTLFHSYAFDFSVWEIFGSILYGGKLIIVPNEATMNPNKLAEILINNKVTILNQTPTAFKNLLTADINLSHKPRMIIFGGEALYPHEIKAWWNKYGLTETMFINMYGITEVTVHATKKIITPDINNSNIGKPLLDMGIIIVDKDNNICPVGVPGEILVCGEGLCKHYINDPEINKKKFITKKFFDLSETRFYKSGDLAKLNRTGDIEYLGRIDKQIKINGHRVETTEIVTALKNYKDKQGHKIIKNVYIRVITTESNIQILVAYYLGSTNVDIKAIKTFLKETLPIYAIPELYKYMNNFPMTVNGKIDNTKLPDVFYNNDMASIHKLDCFVKTAWSEILNIVEVKENIPFFEHGGNSIKAVLLTNKINKSYKNINNSKVGSKKLMSIVDVFRYPTLQEQISIINKRLDDNKNRG